jgi:hypothetical protein
VLTRCGFRRTDELVDDDMDVAVWRWELDLGGDQQVTDH